MPRGCFYPPGCLEEVFSKTRIEERAKRGPDWLLLEREIGASPELWSTKNILQYSKGGGIG